MRPRLTATFSRPAALSHPLFTWLSPLCILCIPSMHSRPRVDAELFLSPSDGTPMYQQIIDQITAKVIAGDWTPGQALPSIRELASASRVSVITVKRAYAELGLAGIIVTRHGMGSFVADSPALPTDLLRAEFNQHFDAMLDCAERLGMSRDELHRRLDDAPTDPTPDSPQGSIR